MNEFEKHLKNHKKELNMDSLNPEIWLNIENQMLKRKNRKTVILLRWVSVAAAIVLGIFFIPSLLEQNPTKVTSNDLITHFNLGQNNYPELVFAKTNLLGQAKIPVDLKDDFKILLDQLEFLDKQYQEYLRYVEKNGYQKFIGKQLANYYETKIELLDKIHSEIQKINSYESTNDEQIPLVNLKL